MDACARIKGIPLKSRATFRKETVRESAAVCVKKLLKNKKELCSVLLEFQHTRSTQPLAEVHFVCLPSHNEEEDITRILPCSPTDVADLLRSLHVHSLKNEEVLLLKESKKLLEQKEGLSQTSSIKAVCIFRHSPAAQINVPTLLGLLSRYTAGIKYALELQSLKRGTAPSGQAEDDDTNHSVSSIEEDFVTAFEHLEEEENADSPRSPSYGLQTQRMYASERVSRNCKDASRPHAKVDAFMKNSTRTQKHSLETSIPEQSGATATISGHRTSLCMPDIPPLQDQNTLHSMTESDDSDCSSPSPIIFLDEVDYQKSMKAKLQIPKVPVLKDGVEDSDSEVSEFFDSFDQFEDLDLLLQPIVKVSNAQHIPGQPQMKSHSAMNPHKFYHPVLPDNIRKPTPLKPGFHSDAPDSPQPVRRSHVENGALFSPVCSSAFMPLGEVVTQEYFWKSDGDIPELCKPHDLCSLYKTYSDFASNLSKEILGSVYGSSSSVIDLNVNNNLSCVCHKEFTSTSGHLMKLSDIQDTLTVANKSRPKYQSLKDGIQKFASDLVEMSVGSAFRDIQKGVSSCTTTLCRLAARLTSSVFQMAFHEIGMRHAYVLKQRAVNGLAGFLVGEAVSGALKEFLCLKSQVFNNTVKKFATDLAEELVFEGMMEVCQFSHPSTPLTSKMYSFEQEEEVFSSYATDLSESVLQEAFIELSQADIAFATQAAISVSACHVASENKQSQTIFSTTDNYPEFQGLQQPCDPEQDDCTIQKALLCVSGMASCLSVPVAGKVISNLPDTESDSTSTSVEGESVSLAGLPPDNTVTTRTTGTNSSATTETVVGKMAREATPNVNSKVRNCASFLNKSVGCQSSENNIFTQPVANTVGKETCNRTAQHQVPIHFVISDTDPVMTMDTIQRHATSAGDGKVMVEEMLHDPDKKTAGPNASSHKSQEPPEVYKERNIRPKCSKKFNGKFTDRISPLAPPSTASRLPLSEVNSDCQKTGLTRARSLSDEASENEVMEDVPQGRPSNAVDVDESEHGNTPEDNLIDNGALHYAGRLACHIVSLATEMDSMGSKDALRNWHCETKDVSHSANFSEPTLNVLWTYAGEIAGEVVNDAKKLMSSHSPHKDDQKSRLSLPTTHDCNTGRLSSICGQWARDCLPSSVSAHSSCSSETSPSSESVSDEYAGHLIKVLKRRGGSRELILDQYASQLANRSIKAGLTHAAHKLKQNSPLRLYPLRHPHCSSGNRQSTLCRLPSSQVSPSKVPVSKVCSVSSTSSQSIHNGQNDGEEYMDLVNLAESLACSITCDVTRKLRVSSVCLPKSLTDSCLYQKTKLENMADQFTKTAFSCAVLPDTERLRQYHSTGSLNEGCYNNDILQVIDHYAKRIVNDTLEVTLGTVAQQSGKQRTVEHIVCSAETLMDAEDKATSRSCYVGKDSDCLCYDAKTAECHCHRVQSRHVPCPDTFIGLEIPKIHIHLDRRAVFAEDMVSTAMVKASKELSSTSLNADSGIGHDGASFAESLTTEIMTSALSNVSQTINLSISGKEGVNETESTLSQQLSLSVGDDSLGSWSNLSFEDEQADESSSFFHLSDSNGNSSSWSSLGLEGEVYEEHLSFSPSDSDGTEDKELENKEELSGGVSCVAAGGERALLVINTELREPGLDPQLRSLLQWVAASIAELPVLQLSQPHSKELQQLPEVMQKVQERQWRIGELLQALLKYYEELHAKHPAASHSTPPGSMSLFQWLIERA
ncbi:A-kinase anchor protein 11 [Engraulis encrasicolus]|uniref:A-kinase anchor protein 11 n=1 Tax=Engraulis encrasicolus TaxID=184585 RepID=UPI002FD42D43